MAGIGPHSITKSADEPHTRTAIQPSFEVAAARARATILVRQFGGHRELILESDSGKVH